MAELPTLAAHYSPGPARQPSGNYTVRTKRTGKVYSLPAVQMAVRGTPVMDLTRTLDGSRWMKGVYGAVYRANLSIARECQRVAIQKLKESLVRPGQSTGKLAEAIAQPGAVYADATKIIVGVGEVIDAEAKYWRAIEEGMDPLPFTAFGFWTTAKRGSGGGGLQGPMEGANNGRPIIMSFDKAPNAKHFFTWRFTRGIEPHLYFADAWDEVRDSGFVEQAYVRAFAETPGAGEFVPSFTGRFGREPGAGDFGL